MNGLRLHRMIRYDEDFLICTLPTTAKGTAKIVAGRGVKIHHVYYWSDEFRDPELECRQVPVRYDPYDIGTAYAFSRNRWVRCHSEFYVTLRGRSEKEVSLATKELRRRHQQHACQRMRLNAKVLATFLESVESQEALLTQRLCDSESTTMRTGLGPEVAVGPSVVQSNSETPGLESQGHTFGDLWRTLNAPKREIAAVVAWSNGKPRIGGVRFIYLGSPASGRGERRIDVGAWRLCWEHNHICGRADRCRKNDTARESRA